MFSRREIPWRPISSPSARSTLTQSCRSRPTGEFVGKGRPGIPWQRHLCLFSHQRPTQLIDLIVVVDLGDRVPGPIDQRLVVT